MADLPDPFRLRVLKRATAMLESVGALEDSNSTSEGEAFFTNLTGRVFRGRTFFGDEDRPPFVVLLEDPTPIEQIPQPSESSASTGLWTFAVQGFVKDDKNNPLDPAYKMSRDCVKVFADEKKRIATERTERGRPATPLMGERGVLDMFIGSPVHRPADGLVSSVAYFYFLVTLRVAETLDT